PCRFQYAKTFGHDLATDAVPFNDCNLVLVHYNSWGVPDSRNHRPRERFSSSGSCVRITFAGWILRYHRRCKSERWPRMGFNIKDRLMKKLRSQEWYGREGRDGFVYRSWMKNQGWPQDLFDGRPVIGICNTWSELTPCNAHFRELAEFVKRGVWEAGGFPLEFPVMSLGETQLRPTAM